MLLRSGHILIIQVQTLKVEREQAWAETSLNHIHTPSHSCERWGTRHHPSCLLQLRCSDNAGFEPPMKSVSVTKSHYYMEHLLFNNEHHLQRCLFMLGQGRDVTCRCSRRSRTTPSVSFENRCDHVCVLSAYLSASRRNVCEPTHFRMWQFLENTSGVVLYHLLLHTARP